MFVIGADQAKQSLVLNFPRHPRLQHVVVHPVEELFQVQVHHPAFAGLNLFLRGFDRAPRAASGQKPVAAFRKARSQMGPSA